MQGGSQQVNGIVQAKDLLASCLAGHSLDLRAATRPPVAVASSIAPSGPPETDTGSTPTAASPSAVKFLKGTIVKVDCTSGPGATLTLTSAGKAWSMQVRDTHHVLVMGADGFSCNWSKQKAALNYRETGSFAGAVVSIEIQ